MLAPFRPNAAVPGDHGPGIAGRRKAADRFRPRDRPSLHSGTGHGGGEGRRGGRRAARRGRVVGAIDRNTTGMKV